MDPKPLKFFEDLLSTPRPSGYEQLIQDVIRKYAKTFADTVTTDYHGNVIAAKNPDAPIRVMLAGHCDQIGLSVQYIDADGFLYVIPLGGWDMVVLVGQKVLVWTKSGPINGVIGRKPIHLLSPDDRKKVPEITDLWVDIGAKNKEEAEALVNVGDAITVELGHRMLRNNFISAPAMDDKSGAWVVMEALRRTNSKKLKCAVFSVATVQEEVGLRGAMSSAYDVNPDIGIAVDVTFSTDCPTIDKKARGDVVVGGGPTITRGPNMNPRVVEQLRQIAAKNNIPVQWEAS
ncbi:MAG: M42 family peptidase, partial [Thermoguttaceae bacterium]|nr:M42 family peptidase [Thermoguttaceae bacterium]